MAIDKLSRVSTLSAGDLVPISSNGLGADAVVSLQSLTDHILEQSEEASGIPNDASVTPEKLATDTVALIDSKIAAAVADIDPGTGGGVTPTAFSPTIDFRSNKSMPISGFYQQAGAITFSVDTTGAIAEMDTTAKILTNGAAITAPGFTLDGAFPTDSGKQVLLDFLYSGGIPFCFVKVLGASATAVPTNSTAPAISGTNKQGQTLTSTTGTWTGSPSSYVYEWRRGGTAITGATASTYQLTYLDVGTVVTCAVTAVNNIGPSASPAVSNGTAAVTAITYTQVAPTMTKWQTAKARGATNPARFSVFGDSNIAGEGAGTGSLGLIGARPLGMAAKIASLGSMNANTFFGEQNVTLGSVGTTQYDARYTLGTGWAPDTSPSKFGGRFITATSPAGEAAFAAGVAFDEYTIYVPKTVGAGSLVVKLDGTTVATIDQSAASGADAYIKQILTTTLGTHTISFSGTGKIYAPDIVTRNTANATPIALIGGWCGARVTDLMVNTFNQPWSARAAHGVLLPDFQTVYATINDCNAGVSASDYGLKVRNYVAAYSSAFNGVLCVGFPSNNANTTNGLLDAYATQLKGIAQDNGWGFFDGRAVFGSSWAEADSKGYAFDGDHPSLAGHNAFATALYNYLVAAGLNTGIAPSVPGAPTLTAGTPTSTTIPANATAPSSGATPNLYSWERKLTSAADSTYTVAGTTPDLTASPDFTYTGLTASTGYSLRLRASADGGSTFGSYSNVATASTAAGSSAGFASTYGAQPDSQTTTNQPNTTNTGSAGAIGIVGGKAVPANAANGGNNIYEVYEGTSANGVMTTSHNRTDFTGFGQITRFKDASNLIQVYFDNTTFVVKVFVNGTSSNVLVVSNVTGITNTNDVIETTLNGSALSCKFNGSAVGSTVTLDAATMTALGTSTKHGIFWNFATTDQTCNSANFVAA